MLTRGFCFGCIVLLAMFLSLIASPLMAQEVDQTKAGSELRSELMLASILKSAPTGIGFVEERMIVEVNDYILDLTGYTREELIGQSARMLYPTQEDYDYVGREKYRQIAEKGTGSIETLWMRKDGSIRDVFLSSTPLDPNDLSRGVTFTVVDITERKHSEERFAKAFGSSPAPLVISEIATGRFIDVNDRWVEMLGHSREEQIGRTSKEVGIWTDPDERDRIVAKLGEKGFFKDEPIQFVTKSGEKKFALWSAEVITLDGRDVLLSLILDETDRRLAEAALAGRTRLFLISLTTFAGVLLILLAWLIVALRHRNEVSNALKIEKDRYGNILESTDVGIWEWNVQTGETTFNERLVGMAGYTLAELAPISFKTWEFLAHPDDLQASKEALEGHFQGDTAFYAAECRIKHKEGHWVWVLDRGKVISRTEDDKPLLVYGTHQDITERKHAEKALMESEKRYRTILNEMAEGYHEVDLAGNFTFFNEAFLNLFGYSSDEMMGTNFSRYAAEVAIAKRLYRTYNETYRTGVPIQSCEWDILRKDGERRTLEFYASLVRDSKDNPVGFRGIVRDVTQDKWAEQEREKLQSQLNQAQKMEAIGTLAGGIAHDFNNMLTVILGYAKSGLNDFDLSHPIHYKFQQILNAANRSADITRQLLAFARKQTIAPKVLDLNLTLEGMLKILHRLIGEDIDLIWKPAPNLWPVKMDSSQIDQILANLCINARDAIAGVGKLTIETGRHTFDVEYCNEHAGFIPGDFVLLAVSDNGCGMDKETLDNLFDPFFTTKDVGKGTGLGLATIYGIVKQNNGFINVYSEPGQGSTFKIYLPRHTAGMAEKIPDRPMTSPPRGSGETILIVEDEATILEMLETILENMNYKVIAAASPSQAMEMAHSHAGQIHLVITDVVMPEMNGRDLAGKITDLYPDIGLLFMSGYTANVIAHQGVLDEGVAFIQKPFSMKDLAVKVREVLDGETNSFKNVPKPVS